MRKAAYSEYEEEIDQMYVPIYSSSLQHTEKVLMVSLDMTQ